MHAPQTTKQASVAIIDNDDSVRHSLEWLTQTAGYDVHVYDSGLSYLDAAAEGYRPDCIVLDLYMPIINGLELYGIIKTQHPDIPIIFITGLPDQGISEKARALEATRFFTKPLEIDALLACIDKTLASSPPQLQP